jgi:hypothetical protein
MTNLTFVKCRENLCNVQLREKDTHWYVEKVGNWYEIQWGNIDELFSFREESWYSSQDKQEIKEKLKKCMKAKVEIKRNHRGIKYAKQGDIEPCPVINKMIEQRRLAHGKRV